MRRFPAVNPLHPAASPISVDLLADWKANGRATIERLRTWMPHHYVRLAATLSPPQSHDYELAALSDEELHRKLGEALYDLVDSPIVPPDLRVIRVDPA